MVQWLKDHFEFLTGGSIAGIFGLGGIYWQHNDHGKRIDKLEGEVSDNKDLVNEKLEKIHIDIGILLDRSKKRDELNDD